MSSLTQHLNIRYQIALALAAAFFLVLTTTAQSTVAKSQKKVTLAFVLFDATNPVSVPARKGAEDAAKKYGFTIHQHSIAAGSRPTESAPSRTRRMLSFTTSSLYPFPKITPSAIWPARCIVRGSSFDIFADGRVGVGCCRSQVISSISGVVVGWAMDAHRDEELVEQAARMALLRRQPEASPGHRWRTRSPATAQ